MHNGMKAGFTLPVLFENYFKLLSSKGSCNFERIFKYYSALEGACLLQYQIDRMVVWVKSGYFYGVEVPLPYTFLYIHLPVLGMVEHKYM